VGVNLAGPNPTELLASAAFLLASADQLPASDPRKGYRRSRNSWIGWRKGSGCTADLGAQLQCRRGNFVTLARHEKGAPTLKKRAMTDTERNRRYRRRKTAQREAARPHGS